MGRQTDAIAVRTSIALLQERFRQLQRAKEMRQHKEVLQQLFETQRTTTNPDISHESSPRAFFCSELIRQPRPPLRNSLDRESNLRSWHPELQVSETPPLLANLWSRDIYKHTANSDDSDVDTSLHL